MKDLLAYLFGGSQVENEVEETKSAIEKIMEEAEEQEPLKVKRSPLVSALKSLGLGDVGKEIEYDPEGFSLVCPEEAEYRRYVEILMSPDAMEKLAKLGWVVTRCGDVAMSNEPAEMRIRFLEISDSDDGEDKDSWPAPNPKLVADLIKKGREFATTPMDRDSENEINPVENPTEAPNEKKAGVGKEQQGKDPEGKPKGSTGKVPEALALANQLIDVNEIEEGRHKPGCQCGFCKNMGSFGKKKKEEEQPEGEPESQEEGAEPQRYDKMFEKLAKKKLIKPKAGGKVPKTF